MLQRFVFELFPVCVWLVLSWNRGVAGRALEKDCFLKGPCLEHSPDLSHNNQTIATNTTLSVDCAMRASCSPFPLGISSDRNCFCDQLCHFFSDCCYDARAWNGSETVSILLGQCTCRQLDSDSQEWYYVIDKCPSSAPDDGVRTQCESGLAAELDVLASLAVSETDLGLVYKNVYCAICHGATFPSELIFWEQEIVCSWQAQDSPVKEDDLLKVTDNPAISRKLINLSVKSVDWQYCTRAVKPPQLLKRQPRTCRSSIAECHPDWTNADTASKCSNGSATYTYHLNGLGVHPTVYKNPFCAVCNFANVSSLTCYPSTHHEQAGLVKDPPSLSMRILLDLNQGEVSNSIRGPDGSLHRTDVSVTECPPNEVYDIFQDSCRAIFCLDGYTMNSEGRCQLETTSSNNSYGSQNETDPLMNDVRCGMLYLNKSHYNMDEDGMITVPFLNKNFSKGEYIFTDNFTLGICSVGPKWRRSEHGQSQFRTKPYLVEAYLSLVGYILSLIGLATLFVIYMVLPPLRNLPGKCLMCLVAALFTAQLLFLLLDLPKPSSWLCLLTSALTHYFYIAAFCWKSVLAFDTWRTFQFNMLKNPEHQSNRRFLVYSLYAWLAPLITVAVSVLVEYEVIPAPAGYRPEYARFYCWINSMQGLLAFFIAPIALLLTANIIFFALTIWSICQTDRTSSIALHGNPHSLSRKMHLVLYIKLSLIMGLTWVFGLLASATGDSVVLWYLFIIFGSLQGLFICIGFTCSRTVHRLMKNGRRESVRSKTFSKVSPESHVNITRSNDHL